jgi:hypothetical protein
VGYASSENMSYIKEELEKEFIMPIKTNRKVALSLEHKKRGEYEQGGVCGVRTGHGKGSLRRASGVSPALV